MTDSDSLRATGAHHRGHSRSAQQAIAAARRCDEFNARRTAAVTTVRALLVELGRAAQHGERAPLIPSRSVGAPVEVLERDLAPR